jgi:hypothetical protein
MKCKKYVVFDNTTVCILVFLSSLIGPNILCTCSLGSPLTEKGLERGRDGEERVRLTVM